MAKIFLKKSDGTFIKDSSGNFVFIWELPNEYQKVEYIESTGTQYIDTGILAKTTLKFDIKIKMNTLSQNGSVISGWDSNYYSQICFNTGISGWILQWGKDWKQYGSTNLNINNFFADLPNRVLKINGQTYTIESTIDSQSSISSMYLFAGNSNGTVARKTNANLYYCKIYDNNTIVRNFIPCYRKSDNAIGLYDVINDVFYTNSGTGTFIKGPNI